MSAWILPTGDAGWQRALRPGTIFAMQISDLLPPAIAWLAMTLPRARAGKALAGGVLAALAIASLAVAGSADWQSANLPASYLAITAALIGAGMVLSIGTAVAANRSGELPDRPVLTILAGSFVLGTGGWIWWQVATGGGLGRSLLCLVGLLTILTALHRVGSALQLARRLQDFDRRVFQRSSPVPNLNPALLAVHLGLVLLAFLAPHLVLLLAGVFGAVITGAMIARERSWPVIAGLALLAVMCGLTMQVAGQSPLTLRDLPDGPWSPAFEVMAVSGFFLAVWPLLGLFPFQRPWGGPASRLVVAALLFRVIVPTLSGGTDHWLPLLFPLLAISVWYAAIAGSPRLAIGAVAVAGLVTLYPSAQWAGVLLLGGEALVSTLARMPAGRKIEAGAVGLVSIAMTGALIPLLAGALKAQVVYSVLIAGGLTLAAWLSPAAESR